MEGLMEYSIVKALHIISVISWMAGMLYLPRLYVYHCRCKPGSEASEMLKVMERKLLKIIINPAMISTWIFGLWLVTILSWENLRSAGWFHMKITMLIGMQICHGKFSRWRKDFEQDKNTRSEKFYRIVNEVPAVLMIVIVMLVVIKPF